MRPTIRVIAVGKLKETFFKDACGDYATRLANLVPKFELIEVTDDPTPDGASAADEASIRQREGVRILAKVGERDYVIACDLAGKQLESPDFAQHLMDAATFHSASTFTIIIGGSLGLDHAVLNAPTSGGALESSRCLISLHALSHLNRPIGHSRFSAESRITSDV